MGIKLNIVSLLFRIRKRVYCECVLHSKNEAVSILYLFEIQIALQVIDAVRQPAPKAPVGVVRAGLIACTASPHTQDAPPSPIARGLRKRPEHFRVLWRLMGATPTTREEVDDR